MSIDEISELAIYDSNSIQARKELMRKKIRTVFLNTPITIRITFKNQLSSSFLDLKNIKVCCKYLNGELKSE